MKPKLIFELDRSKHGQFFVRIVARNGREVWRTSETYKTRAGAKAAISVLVDSNQTGDYEIRDLTKSVATHKRRGKA